MRSEKRVVKYHRVDERKNFGIVIFGRKQEKGLPLWYEIKRKVLELGDGH